MVKIKDFTIGTKKLGGGDVPPPVPYTTSAHGAVCFKTKLSLMVTVHQFVFYNYRTLVLSI